MERAADPRMARFSRGLARGCALAIVGVATMVELGWALNVWWLRQFDPTGVPMNPVTAMGLALTGMSLWIMTGVECGPGVRGRQGAQVLAGVVFVLGMQRLLALWVGFPWSLDGLVFEARLEKNRMAPNTAACLVLVGMALATLDVEAGRRYWRPAVLLTLMPFAIAMLAITGYIYGVTPMMGMRGHIAMALNTAICFVLASIGILAARPGKEPAATLCSNTAGGVSSRRLLPLAVAVPLALGYLRLQGEHWGLYDTHFGVAAFAVAIVAVFVVMVYLSARSLARAEIRRRATEAALSASEAFYHSLVETLPQHIFRKDLKGRFTFANRRFLGEIGKTMEQVAGKTDFDFYPSELATRYRRDDQEVIRTGKALETVEAHVTPSGEKLYVQVIKTAVYDDTGRVIGTQGIFWDVTEKHRAQELLAIKNQELEEAAEAQRQANEALRAAQGQLVQSEKLAGLGQMVAGVAHEINNPLSFVGNNVVVIQRDVEALRKLVELYRKADGSIPPEVAEQIRELEEQIDLPYTLSNLEGLFTRSREGLRRIQQIVKDLRDFARLDQSEVAEVDLSAGIESTLNIIQGHAKRKGVTVVTELAARRPVRCCGAKINQVVMNLVGNAIDASPNGSQVTVRTREEGGGVSIVVSDQGHGIPRAIREKIFDPFFTTKPVGQGTGLGLSISYGIVKEHGGKIEVESEEGRGTTFAIWLPYEAALK